MKFFVLCYIIQSDKDDRLHYYYIDINLEWFRISHRDSRLYIRGQRTSEWYQIYLRRCGCGYTRMNIFRVYDSAEYCDDTG